MEEVLPLNSSGNLILHGTGVVIPKSLQRHVVELARESHQGLVKAIRYWSSETSQRRRAMGFKIPHPALNLTRKSQR